METSLLFGDWLEKRRKALDMTREELARQANCSVSALRKIESNERRPSKQLAEMLAIAVGVPQEEQQTFIKLARGESSKGLAEPSPVLPSIDLLQSSPKPAHNLPAPATPLLGREEELNSLNMMLHDPNYRLITLTGLGGIGKTRLAIEAARTQREAFAGGVFFVALAPINSPDFITPAIANTLGFTFSGFTDPTTQLLEYLREKQLLLILDNFEHLLEGADLILQILEYAPGVKLLLTSREQLNLRGEWVFEVQGLPIPAENESMRLEDAGAVHLFVESARRIHAGFILNESNSESVAQICRLVEGLPLAIELAASWEQTLSCREIAQEVERNLDFLAAPMRGVPNRHRSMRAVFDHSWKMLSDRERNALMRLSVFRGGFSHELAEQVAGAKPELLSTLIMKSLIRRTGEERYDMHEMVRQYALLQLEQANLKQQAHNAHVMAFMKLAEEAEPRLIEGDPGRWLSYLEYEHDNFRAALQWAFDSGDSESGLRISSTLWRFWHLHSYLKEGSQWLKRALDAAGAAAAPKLRAKALVSAGFLAYYQNQFDQAIKLLEESLTMQSQIGEREIANANVVIAMIVEQNGDFPRATSLYGEAIKHFRNQNDEYGIFCALNGQGSLYYAMGELEMAEKQYIECLELARKRGDRDNIATALCNQGWIAAMRGNTESVGLCREALEIFEELGNKFAIANCLEGLAGGIALEGHFEQSVKLFGAASALREAIGAPPNDIDVQNLEHMIQSARQALPAEVYEALWEGGRAMTLEQAIQCAFE